MFTLALEIFVIFVKNNPKIKGLEIFRHEFLYTTYADDTAFFLKDRQSIIELMNELNTFSNGVQVALCDMKRVTLNNETVKIVGVHFS